MAEFEEGEVRVVSARKGNPLVVADASGVHVLEAGTRVPWTACRRIEVDRLSLNVSDEPDLRHAADEMDSWTIGVVDQKGRWHGIYGTDELRTIVQIAQQLQALAAAAGHPVSLRGDVPQVAPETSRKTLPLRDTVLLRGGVNLFFWYAAPLMTILISAGIAEAWYLYGEAPGIDDVMALSAPLALLAGGHLVGRMRILEVSQAGLCYRRPLRRRIFVPAQRIRSVTFEWDSPETNAWVIRVHGGKPLRVLPFVRWPDDRFLVEILDSRLDGETTYRRWRDKLPGRHPDAIRLGLRDE